MAYYRAVASADTAASSAPERIGVLLVNLGTPDSPSYFAVQRYLREFLSDRRVAGTFRPLWLPLLYGVILPLRALRAARKYRKIWLTEGSPLAVHSQGLTIKIGALLHANLGDRVRVALAMTYGMPDIARAVQSLAEQNVKKLLVLPLFPQYSTTTTGSVFDRTTAVLRRWRWLPETRFVNGYYHDAAYIDALAAQIRKHWPQADERSHLLFWYHGIPAAHSRDGDPYEAQAGETTRLLAARLGLAQGEWSHCYQSRFGTAAWLQPHVEEALKTLLERGVRKLTVVAPSFAVDCLETLEEIGIEYRGKFLRLGGERLTLVPALNDDDSHARVMHGIVVNQLRGWIAGGAP
jgi:protoporphyrin/coproporphyrin ferrochelatase